MGLGDIRFVRALLVLLSAARLTCRRCRQHFLLTIFSIICANSLRKKCRFQEFLVKFRLLEHISAPDLTVSNIVGTAMYIHLPIDANGTL